MSIAAGVQKVPFWEIEDHGDVFHCETEVEATKKLDSMFDSYRLESREPEYPDQWRVIVDDVWKAQLVKVGGNRE